MIQNLELVLEAISTAVKLLEFVAHATRLRALLSHGQRVLLALAARSPARAVLVLVGADILADAASIGALHVHVRRV